MRIVERLLVLAFTAALVAPAAAQEAPARPEGPKPVRSAEARPLAIKALRIVPVVGDPIDHGVILLQGGRIEQLGKAADIEIPDGYEVREYPTGWITPGWVDLHAHVAGTDINDMVYPTNPELRNVDTIVPDNWQLQAARAGGTTTILFIPGSGTNLSGFGTLVKTAGKTVEEMIVRSPGALKIAQLGNPERRAGDVGRTRMGMNYLLRERLAEAKRYADQWDRPTTDTAEPPPRKDERLELFRGLFRRDFPVIVHTVWVNGIEATKRLLHDELGLDVIITHATFDSYKAADVIVGANMPVNVGPRMIHYEPETGRILGLSALWKDAGADLSINTDCPVIPAEELTTQACVSVRFGLSEKAALEGLSIIPARQVGMGDRLGSLEPGKDADLVIRDGPPLDVRSKVLFVVVNGKPAYDIEKDKRWF